MRKLIYLSLIFSLTLVLKAQIETEFLFDFQAQSDDVKNIQLFDYNQDGIEEFCVSVSTTTSWDIKIYNLAGELIDTLSFDYSTIGNPFKKTCFFAYNGNNYVAVLITNAFLEPYFYHKLDIYDMNNVLISSNQSNIYNWDYCTELSNYNLVSEELGQDLILSYSYLFGWHEDGPGVNSGGTSSRGKFLEFDGYSLSPIVAPIDLFHNYQAFSNKALFYRHSWWSSGGSNGSETIRGLLDIDVYPNSVIVDTLSTSPFSKILGTDDLTNSVYGAICKSNNTFTCFAPTTNDTLWYSAFSYFGNNWDVTASANITIDNDDKYLIYFEDQLCEIRDRTNGNIVHFEEMDSIHPNKLLRNQYGEVYIVDKNNNLYNIFKILNVSFAVDIDQNIVPNNTFSLSNHPNPFNPSTTIEFSIRQDSRVELSIFNIKGHKVKTLAQNDFTKGSHSVVWNGENESEKPVSSGVYYYRLNVNGKTEAVNKCLLLK